MPGILERKINPELPKGNLRIFQNSYQWDGIIPGFEIESLCQVASE
jgi:hypothetical protein